jgi:hypothetical protein
MAVVLFEFNTLDHTRMNVGLSPDTIINADVESTVAYEIAIIYINNGVVFTELKACFFE